MVDRLQPRLQMTGFLEVSKTSVLTPPLPLRKDLMGERLPSRTGPRILLLRKEGRHEMNMSALRLHGWSAGGRAGINGCQEHRRGSGGETSYICPPQIRASF